MPNIDSRLITAFILIIGCTWITFRLLLRHPLRLSGLKYVLLAAFLVRFIPAVTLPRGASYEMHVFNLATDQSRQSRTVKRFLVICWFASGAFLHTKSR